MPLHPFTPRPPVRDWHCLTKPEALMRHLPPRLFPRALLSCVCLLGGCYLLSAAAFAQEYYQKETIELEVNRSTGEDAFLTFIRRDGIQPPERLAVAIPVSLRKDEGESGAGISPEIKVVLRSKEAEITATGTFDDGKPATVLSGTYRLRTPAERAAAEKERAEKLDAELNRIYGEVKAKLPPARAAVLKDQQREWIHSVYTPEPIAPPRDDPAGEHWRNQADHAAGRIAFLRGYAASLADAGPPSLQTQLQAAEEAEAWPAVAEIARHMLANAPKDSALWEKRARAFARTEDWERCQATVEEWARTTQQKLPAMDSLRGNVAQAQDRDDNAIAAWTACVRAAPKDADTRDKLADLLEERNEWAEAVKLREQRVKIEATVEALADLAVAHAVLQNWKQAGAEMHRASAMDAASERVHHDLPRMERAERVLGEIKNFKKAMAAAPRSVGPLLERAAFFFELGWPEIALKDAEDALKLWPESRGALLQKASALLALERRDEAEKIKVNVFRLYQKQPAVLRALAKTDAALQANGPDATTLGRRAHHLNRLQQYALSDADTEAALKLNPDCDTALAARAESLAATGFDWKALPDAKRAAELNPRNELALFLLGKIEVQHHNYAEAVLALTKLIGVQPKDREALQLREKSYRELGRTAEAETDAAVQKTLELK